MWTAAYIALIVAVNYGFSVFPLISLPTGDLFPPMSLVVGFVFVTRDYAQRHIGHWVIIAMLVAGGLSWIMASPFVAMASVTAFLISEFADWAVYTWTKRSFRDRVLWSSAIGTPIDSAVFLSMLGAFSPVGVVVMTLSKIVGALIVWQTLKGKDDAIR